MPFALGLLWAAGGAIVTLVGIIILAASQEPADAGARPAKSPPTASELVTVARAQALEEDCNRLREELRPWTEFERKVAVLLAAGAQAQCAKIGDVDYAALLNLVAHYLSPHLPAPASARFDQLIAKRLPIHVIASAAVEQGVFAEATKVIQDILGLDEAAWSPAAQVLFREWQQGFQKAGAE